MNTLDLFLIIVVAGLIHASFQLSISVLTLLSAHTIGAKRSHARLVLLSNAFTFGVAVATMLLVSFVAFVASQYVRLDNLIGLWVVGCGLLLGLGTAVWGFYYRKEQGTTLWLPRPLARYLSDRTKATKQSGEAFGLGLSSVIGELLFIVAPIFVAALALVQLPSQWQVAGVLTYTFISLLTLLVINALIGSGHRISRIQRWREDNKRFLQFIAGSGLIVLGFYIYVDQVLTPSVMALAGGV